MPVEIAPATQAALDAGAIVDRGMILFDLGSGLYGFWTGAGPFVHNGVTYVGAGSLIEVDGVRQTSGLESVGLVARLTAIENSELTPDVLATIEQEVYHQRPCTIMTTYFDAGTLALLSVEVKYRGIIDRILHTESIGGQAALEVYLESRTRDHQRTGYRRRGDVDQRRLNPLDDSMRHVAIVATERVLFGRSDKPPPKPKKKGLLARLFG